MHENAVFFFFSYKYRLQIRKVLHYIPERKNLILF
jgi:hypothetical protein